MKSMRYLIVLSIFLLPFQLFAIVDIQVTFSLGRVQVSSDGGKNWKKLSRGQKIGLNDVIRTGRPGTAMLKLERRYDIKLSANTTLKISSLFPDMSFHLSQGKVWAKVNKLGIKQKFSIRTPSSVVGVRGTEFIYETAKVDRLYMLEGVVDFGKDFENTKKVLKGQIAIFKDGLVQIRRGTKKGVLNLKSGFPQFILPKQIREKLQSLRNMFDRQRMKEHIRRALTGFSRDRDFLNTKIKDDLITGRTVKGRDGYVTRVQQLVRKLGDNKIRIINITKKTNFLNVLQYTGEFNGSIPNTFDELINMSDIQNRELYKDIYIVQIDNQGVLPAVDRMRIYENKTDPNNKSLKMWTTKDGSTITLAALIANADANVTDYTRLKQRDTDPYLSATYTFGADGTSTMTLKVYMVDKDGKVINMAPGGGGISMDLDFLLSMSMEFVFEGTSTLTTPTNLFSSTNGVRFTTLPDVGFVIMNEFVE